MQLSTNEDGAGWLAFFRDLVARGLNGVGLATSVAHASLGDALGTTLPGASWQRCRTHYAANPPAVPSKSAWGWVNGSRRSCTRSRTSPTPTRSHAQSDRDLDALADKLPEVHDHLDAARADILAFTPRRSGDRVKPRNTR